MICRGINENLTKVNHNDNASTTTLRHDTIGHNMASKIRRLDKEEYQKKHTISLDVTIEIVTMISNTHLVE